MLLIPLIGAAALAMDLSFAYLVTLEMQNAADLTALAGVKRLAMQNASYDAVYNAARVTAEKNTIRMNQTTVQRNENIFGIPCGQQTLRNSVILEEEDVDVGIYNFENGGFTTVDNIDTPGTNAVRSVVRQSPGGNQPFSFQLARIFGLDQMLFRRQAIASYGRRHIVIALDISSSMDDFSYPHFCTDSRTCVPTNPSPTVLAAGNCPTADEFHDAPEERNFRIAPKALDDPNNCLGGLPQPIYNVFEVTRDTLLENQLFDAYYRVGLVLYGSAATELVSLDTDENKVDLQNFLTNEGLNYWQSYSDSQDPLLFNPGGGQIFPGGDDPLGEVGERTGYTNIFGAIRRIRLMLNQADEETNTRLVSTAVLLSDGVANCDRRGRCADNTAGRARGINHAIQESRVAARDGIVLHTVYFATSEPCFSFRGQRFTMAEGYRTLIRISSATGGQAFCAQNIGQLGTIFDNIRQQPPFVLVE